MSNIIEKIALIKQTKLDIKQSLMEKGCIVGDVFSTYAGLIRSLNTSGSGGTPSSAIASSVKITYEYNPSYNLSHTYQLTTNQIESEAIING